MVAKRANVISVEAIISRDLWSSSGLEVIYLLGQPWFVLVNWLPIRYMTNQLLCPLIKACRECWWFRGRNVGVNSKVSTILIYRRNWDWSGNYVFRWKERRPATVHLGVCHLTAFWIKKCLLYVMNCDGVHNVGHCFIAIFSRFGALGYLLIKMRRHRCVPTQSRVDCLVLVCEGQQGMM